MCATNIPHVSKFLQSGFLRYSRWLVRRHFHAVAVDRSSTSVFPLQDGRPLIVYGNHPSWWDPLIAVLLNQSMFPDRQYYAPIDATSLEKYRILSKLGFFGISMDSTSGAAKFLRTSKAILESGNTAIWMTPEGRFTDVRDQSASFMPGLSHLCSKIDRGWALPLAMEYVFWDERLPVCLIRLGTPIDLSQQTNQSKSLLDVSLSEALRSAQADLAHTVIERESEPFELLVSGRAGSGGAYDLFRRMRSIVTRRKFEPQHGKQFG